MIGYHYTTKEAWTQIQLNGMSPAPIRKHELDRFREEVPDMPSDAIWVWKDIPSPEAAWVVTANLASMHKSFELVLLEIEYEDSSACSIKYAKDSDIIKLKCTFSAGSFTTGHLPIELLISEVNSDNIKLLHSFNLLKEQQ
jgi:hypothetical protein